jgi:predicted flap endonuclease-1-like 5' DNA nuclease
MTFTLNDIVLLAIALLIGLVLGLMMSGRGKYKRYWREEQLAHRNAIKDRDTRLAAANERIAELERQSGPIGPGTATAVAGGVDGRDDLSHIHGITQQDEIALNEAGYHRFGQVAAINGEQEAALEARLGLKPGIIAREKWREQAKLLDARKYDEHAHLYARRPTRV